jgi:hypothetical protein
VQAFWCSADELFGGLRLIVVSGTSPSADDWVMRIQASGAVNSFKASASA